MKANSQPSCLGTELDTEALALTRGGLIEPPSDPITTPVAPSNA
jgi:hypothetical protein